MRARKTPSGAPGHFRRQHDDARDDPAIARRAIRSALGLGGAITLAAAIVLGSPTQGMAQQGEIVSDCELSTTARDALEEDIETALDLDPDTASAPLVIVVTFNDDLGQPIGGNFTSIVICSQDGVDTVVESAPFPPGNDTADLRELQQTSFVLIEPTGGGLRQLRICHANDINECVDAVEPEPEPEPEP